MNNYNNQDNIKKVMDCIKKNKYGSTIKEISDKTKLAKNTIVKIVIELDALKKIVVRRSGRNKMHFIK